MAVAEAAGITVAAEVAVHVIGKEIVDPLIQKMHDVIDLNVNRKVLRNQLESRKLRLQEVNGVFERHQRTVPEVILNRLESTRVAIEEAEKLIERSKRRQRCLHCICSAWECLLCKCKPSIPTEIREWTTRIDTHFNELKGDLEAFVQGEAAAMWAKPKNLPQPVPDVIFEGSGTTSVKTELQKLLTELQKLLTEDPHVREISVYGMPGVGKTTLLKMVYNSHKVSEASIFTDVIWVTVSQRCEIPDLQDQIALEIGLKLPSLRTSAIRKSMLSESLKKKKFLLILDDLWSALNLQEVGVALGEGSKVVFSTRFRDLAESGAEKSIEVQTLSAEEGRVLFERLAFRRGPVPKELMDCARKTADECKGLPLAITVVAAAVRGKTVDEWNLFLSLMKIADPSFPNTHRNVDEGLYQILRTSYKDLPRAHPNLQHCFLYCAMYPEDKKIDVDALVRLWIAEGLVQSREATYSMDMKLGRSYVKDLIDRGLFQDATFERRRKKNIQKPVNVWKGEYITVHDVIRDMAIYVGEEENFLCRAGLQLKDFPDSETRDSKRISLFGNQIGKVPDEFICPMLVSLILSENPLISSVPESSPINLNSLRVLDLSHTQIESVPTWVAQLKLLKFLSLSSTNIKELPAAICSLCNLQFLDLSDCKALTSLPPEMSKLTSLKRLYLSMGMEKALNDPKNVIALKGLKNLIELRLFLFLKFDAYEMMALMASITGTWLEMRHLHLHHMNSVRCNLPQEMQNMNKLESLVLVDYIGLKLPNCICDFQQLERLELNGSDKVKELPQLERLSNLKFLKLRNYSELKDLKIGSSGNSEGFPMLETLHLSNLLKLTSMAEEGTLKEGTLLKLQVLKITKCPVLRKLPKGMEKLSLLTAIYGHKRWWENITWEYNDMKMHLLNLFKEI